MRLDSQWEYCAGNAGNNKTFLGLSNKKVQKALKHPVSKLL